MKLIIKFLKLFRKQKKEPILKWYNFPRETWLAHGIWKTGRIDDLIIK